MPARAVVVARARPDPRVQAAVLHRRRAPSRLVRHPRPETLSTGDRAVPHEMRLDRRQRRVRVRRLVKLAERAVARLQRERPRLSGLRRATNQADPEWRAGDVVEPKAPQNPPVDGQLVEAGGQFADEVADAPHHRLGQSTDLGALGRLVRGHGLRTKVAADDQDVVTDLERDVLRDRRADRRIFRQRSLERRETADGRVIVWARLAMARRPGRTRDERDAGATYGLLEPDVEHDAPVSDGGDRRLGRQPAKRARDAQVRTAPAHPRPASRIGPR